VSLDAASKGQLHKTNPFITKPPKHIPLHYLLKPTTTFSHHFRSIAPPGPAARGDRSIVFLGYLHTGMQAIHAQARSIWSYAYMEGFLPPKDTAPLASLLDDKTEVEREFAWIDRWFRTRYLGIWDGIFLATFETREVVDRILLDLGIRSDRKGMLVKRRRFYGWRCFFAECFTSYGSSEYARILYEYLALMEKKTHID
jgi:dimethylaniline monooxygenase (N-oxide forming)